MPSNPFPRPRRSATSAARPASRSSLSATNPAAALPTPAPSSAISSLSPPPTTSIRKRQKPAVILNASSARSASTVNEEGVPLPSEVALASASTWSAASGLPSSIPADLAHLLHSEPCMEHHDNVIWNAPWTTPIDPSDLTPDYMARHGPSPSDTFYGPQATPIVVAASNDSAWEQLGGRKPSRMDMEYIGEQSSYGFRDLNDKHKIMDANSKQEVPMKNFRNLVEVYEESYKRRPSTAGPGSTNPLNQCPTPRLNLLSFLADDMPIGKEIEPPTIIKQLDLAYRYKDLKHPDDPRFWKSIGPWTKHSQILITVNDCFTGWHVDAGGSSAYQHLVEGLKIWYWVPSTPENLSAYYAAERLGQHHSINLFHHVYGLVLQPGQVLLTPAASIHAVKTLKSSIMLAGGFFTSFDHLRHTANVQHELKSKFKRDWGWSHVWHIFWYEIKRYERMLCAETADEVKLNIHAAIAQDPHVMDTRILEGIAHLCEWLPAWRDTGHRKLHVLPMEEAGDRRLRDLAWLIKQDWMSPQGQKNLSEILQSANRGRKRASSAVITTPRKVTRAASMASAAIAVAVDSNANSSSSAGSAAAMPPKHEVGQPGSDTPPAAVVFHSTSTEQHRVPETSQRAQTTTIDTGVTQGSAPPVAMLPPIIGSTGQAQTIDAHQQLASLSHQPDHPVQSQPVPGAHRSAMQVYQSPVESRRISHLEEQLQMIEDARTRNHVERRVMDQGFARQDRELERKERIIRSQLNTHVDISEEIRYKRWLTYGVRDSGHPQFSASAEYSIRQLGHPGHNQTLGYIGYGATSSEVVGGAGQFQDEANGRGAIHQAIRSSPMDPVSANAGTMVANNDIPAPHQPFAAPTPMPSSQPYQRPSANPSLVPHHQHDQCSSGSSIPFPNSANTLEATIHDGHWGQPTALRRPGLGPTDTHPVGTAGTSNGSQPHAMGMSFAYGSATSYNDIDSSHPAWSAGPGQQLPGIGVLFTQLEACSRVGVPFSGQPSQRWGS